MQTKSLVKKNMQKIEKPEKGSKKEKSVKERASVALESSSCFCPQATGSLPKQQINLNWKHTS